MSQHYYHETDPDGSCITVLLGWDRPLQHVFLDVTKESNDRKTEEMLYSNLDDPRSGGQGLVYYRSKVSDLGLCLPETMYAEVEKDQANNAGNRIAHHTHEGFEDQ
jgi:hypothetical protein